MTTFNQDLTGQRLEVRSRGSSRHAGLDPASRKRRKEWSTLYAIWITK